MTAPANGQIVCDQSTCALVCDDGFIPTGRRRSKCRWNNTRNFFWKKTLADCETCTDLPDPPAGITADCGINAIRKKKCLYKCDNGSEISTSSGDFLQFSAACSCPRPDRICRWKSRKVGEIDATALSSWTCPNPTVPTTTTQAPPTSPTDPTTPTNPPVPGICDANKPSTCSSLTTAQIGLENEWTCRNCFRINAHYALPPTWQAEDFLVIKFKIPVTWTTWSHPIDSVEALDSLTWKVNFAAGANFDSGMMFDANLMALQSVSMTNNAVFDDLKSCPCSNESEGTTASPGGSFTHYNTRDSDIENGACGLMWSGSNLGTTMFVALDQDTDYDSSRNCGRCIKMKCECTQSQFTGACATGQETIAIVADNCPDAGMSI
ncbi:unnamed protein product [Oikopleura dioica]|uniref:Expansin-like EG45 domain-containing protein n=1 Tax=Oikopleura dioica TaxID=34765 RepID=E4YAW4_OIKDI|nr:unnamed protein product [Oikopleura dioica]